MYVVDEVPKQIFNSLTEGDRTNTQTDTTVTYETSGYESGETSRKSNVLICSLSSVSDFQLDTFLKSDIVGQALLSKSHRQPLTNHDRDKLSELLIKHLVNKFVRLSNEDLKILSKKIEQTIPNEKASTYFVQPIPKSKSVRNISERSRGKLADKQRNLLWLISSINREEKSIRDKNLSNSAAEVVKGKFIKLF